MEGSTVVSDVFQRLEYWGGQVFKVLKVELPHQVCHHFRQQSSRGGSRIIVVLLYFARRQKFSNTSVSHFNLIQWQH